MLMGFVLSDPLEMLVHIADYRYVCVNGSNTIFGMLNANRLTTIAGEPMDEDDCANAIMRSFMANGGKQKYDDYYTRPVILIDKQHNVINEYRCIADAAQAWMLKPIAIFIRCENQRKYPWKNIGYGRKATFQWKRSE